MLRALVIVLATVAVVSTQRGQPDGEWRAYAADEAGTRYAPLDQINRQTVGNLRIAWRQSSLPDPVKKDVPDAGPPPGNYQHTPLMVDGLVYISTSVGRIAALDAATGEVVWFDRAPDRAGSERGPRPTSTRGLAYWSEGSDARVIGLLGPHLVALHAKTGQRIAAFGQDGAVDLRQGLRRPFDGYRWSSAPIVVRNVIVVGSFVTDVNNAGRPFQMQSPPGDVRGYDVRSGRLLWTFHTVPRPGEFGNETWLNDSWSYTGHTNVWATMSGDEELGHVYLPLTTPTNDWYGGHRPGGNLFAESIVALDAGTGARVWHFQGVHHGLWDYDFPCQPILADITVNGRRIKAIAQPSKQSYLYVLNRETGEPVWPIEERPVPTGDVTGEWYAPTQPVPLDARGRPFSYDQQGVSIDDLIDFTPELRAEAEKILSDYAYGPLFFPPVVPGEGAGAGKRGSMHMPGTYGGTNWPGAALDPETNMLYVPSHHTPIIVQLVPPPDGSDMRYVRRGWEPAVGPDRLPLFKPPYGRLVAIDLNKGEIAWTVANGDGPRDHPRLAHLNLPPLGNPGRTGPTVTRHLVFMGEGYSTHAGGGPPWGGGNMFRAFDKTTGEVVWETRLDGAAAAPAMSYSWQGKQFVVVAVGANDHPGELVAFALP